MKTQDTPPMGFPCPEGTRLLITRPDGSTFTALIDGAVRVVGHIEMSEGRFFADQMNSATITVSASAVKDENGFLYHLATPGAVEED